MNAIWKDCYENIFLYTKKIQFMRVQSKARKSKSKNGAQHRGFNCLYWCAIFSGLRPA